jgi:hypothetical protein
MKQPQPFTLEFDRLLEAAPDMLEMLYRVLPIVEDAKFDTCYKPGYVAKLERELLALIQKVEA